jgi:hypothetical protein
MNHACSHCLLLCRENLIDVGNDCTILVGMAASSSQNLLTVASDSMEPRLSCTHCFKALSSPSITVLFILYSTSWIFVCNVEVLEIRFAGTSQATNCPRTMHLEISSSMLTTTIVKMCLGMPLLSTGMHLVQVVHTRHVMEDESQITRCLHPRRLELSIMLMRM